jgi:putative RNA 2'-phosphotransferase
MKNKDLSKYLSLVSRHQPDVLGITLDPQGWTSVETLLAKMQEKKTDVDLA